MSNNGDYKIKERLDAGDISEYNLFDINGNIRVLKNLNFFSTTATIENIKISSANFVNDYLVIAYYSTVHKLIF